MQFAVWAPSKFRAASKRSLSSEFFEPKDGERGTRRGAGMFRGVAFCSGAPGGTALRVSGADCHELSAHVSFSAASARRNRWISSDKSA
jgi:hypothetical protein